MLILAIMGFVPAPTSDYLIVFQSFFLALSFLVVGRGGATYVGLVSGLLITFVKLGFFPVDLVFSALVRSSCGSSRDRSSRPRKGRERRLEACRHHDA